MNSPRVNPELEHLLPLIGRDQLSMIVLGHLIIGSIMEQLIETKARNPGVIEAVRIAYSQQVRLCQALGMFESELANYLLHINSFRNRFAHRLGYSLEFEDSFGLAIEAAGAGIDFSDNLDNDKSLALEIGTDAVLAEVISNTAMHLSFVLYDNGGGMLFT